MKNTQEKNLKLYYIGFVRKNELIGFFVERKCNKSFISNKLHWVMDKLLTLEDAQNKYY